jgi:hypothetical protein
MYFTKLFHLVHSVPKAHCGHKDLLASHTSSLTDYQTYSSPGSSIHIKFLPCIPVNCPPGYTCWRHVLRVLVWIWGILYGGVIGNSSSLGSALGEYGNCSCGMRVS